MVNPYQEMGRCPECNSFKQDFLDGYNWPDGFHAILKCKKCEHVHTKIIKTEVEVTHG
jgi:uncharacterized Zn finger protein